MIYHVFDVDGTITPPRKHMEEDFLPRFLDFCQNNNVVLVSGSDQKMIAEQIPKEILSLVKLYTCNGAEGISFDIEYDIIDEKLISLLDVHLALSYFPIKTGKHINFRKGMINFSTIGRNASYEQRKEYVSFDEEVKERKSIVNHLSLKFPEYEFRIGGEISIDISKKGINKSLVAKDLLTLDPETYIIFYGNQIADGNDKPLAEYIEEHNLGRSIPIDYDDLKLFI